MTYHVAYGHHVDEEVKFWYCRWISPRSLTWVDRKIEFAMIHEVDHGIDVLRFYLLEVGAASFAFLRIMSTWLSLSRDDG